MTAHQWNTIKVCGYAVFGMVEALDNPTSKGQGNVLGIKQTQSAAGEANLHNFCSNCHM